jgi:hypothetical protein
MLGLLALAWHILHSRQAPLPPVAEMRVSPAPTASPASALPTAVAKPSPRPTPQPGLATGLPTWIAQLEFINRDQAALQKAEWNLAQALVRAIRDYIEKVVLPAIKRVQELPVNSS